MNRFSFFRAPISNVVPHATVRLRQIYNAVRGDYYREATEELRRLCRRQKAGEVSRQEVQRFKAAHFDYATFSGIFSRRRSDALVEHSGLLCFDFDHVDQWHSRGTPEGVYGLRYVLLNDKEVDFALIFRSPGGDGLKWVVPIDTALADHAEWFDALACYVQHTYDIAPDPSGRDVTRACYLPWDPDVALREDGGPIEFSY